MNETRSYHRKMLAPISRQRSQPGRRSLKELKESPGFHAPFFMPAIVDRERSSVGRPQAVQRPPWTSIFPWVFVLCALVMGSMTVTAAWSYGPMLITFMLLHVLVACLVKAALLTAVICS